MDAFNSGLEESLNLIDKLIKYLLSFKLLQATFIFNYFTAP